MSREIKFRAWSDKTKMFYVGAEDFKSHEFSLFVENCILMQYTGLKDKNGKEIFEGDIVRAAYPRETITGKVIYRDTGALFLIEYQEFSFNFSYECRTYEIIGNIYSNPKLLEPSLGKNAEPIRNISEDDKKDDR